MEPKCINGTGFTCIPMRPGVYFFKNAAGEIVYIGKAKNLRNRIRSYFRKSVYDWKVESLIAEYDLIDFVETVSDMEALLLEATLIKEHKPKFNVLLKSGNPFVYIVFTGQPIPEMKLARNKKEKGTYYGPFLSKKEAKSVFHFLRRMLRLHICNQRIDGGCLDYHLGICAGRCLGSFDVDEYKTRLSIAQELLDSNIKKARTLIAEQIKKFNEAREYEKAQNLAQYLENLEPLLVTLKAHFHERKYEVPVYAIAHASQEVFDTCIPGLKELQELLKLPVQPRVIDCFDISHFQSQNLVGSCVRFVNGLPEKSGFRRFKIKTLTQQNDYAALHEIVERRYAPTTGTATQLPDIVVIDGGKGQRNAVIDVVPRGTICLSLAKEEERLFTPLHPEGVVLNIHSPLGKLIIALRDYAHHFAISYQRLLASKRAV
jgi:excinuclease ABC subunit C